MADPIDLEAALATFDEPWQPRTVAALNDYDVRVAKAHGEFAWHTHPDTDEFFLVVSGSLTIRLQDDEVSLGPGQAYVVPRGVRHQPVIAVGTAMIAAQLVTFLVMTLSRLPCRVMLVSRMVVTRSRRDSVHSVARRTWS